MLDAKHPRFSPARAPGHVPARTCPAPALHHATRRRVWRSAVVEMVRRSVDALILRNRYGERRMRAMATRGNHHANVAGWPAILLLSFFAVGVFAGAAFALAAPPGAAEPPAGQGKDYQEGSQATIAWNSTRRAGVRWARWGFCRRGRGCVRASHQKARARARAGEAACAWRRPHHATERRLATTSSADNQHRVDHPPLAPNWQARGRSRCWRRRLMRERDARYHYAGI